MSTSAGNAQIPSVNRRATRALELVIARAGTRSLLLAYLPLAFAVILFALRFPDDFDTLFESAFDLSAPALAEAKQRLLDYARLALPASALLALAHLWREWRGTSGDGAIARGLAALLLAAPLLGINMVEHRHPLLSGLAVLLLAFGVASTVPRLTPKPWIAWVTQHAEPVARWTVVSGYVVFVAWVGFMAHWRFITFNAAAYDMSWETNAVHTIVHHGVPMTSVGAGSYYLGEHLPVSYAALHTPWIYYLYAPFYALFQDARTLIWLQTSLMGSGAFGVYWICRRRLLSPLLAAVMGLSYLLYPHVQVYCMHDVHANILAIPLCLLGLGAMEQGYHRSALALALLTCICREETAVYGLAMGAYWATSRSSRTRVRYGFATAALSLAILLFITRFVMPKAGGIPRFSHFGMFFDDPGIASLLKSYVLNTWGALSVFLSSPRPEYVWLSLLPLGLFGIFGARGAIFLLIPAGLLLSSGQGTFFTIGINYSAPIVVPAFMLSIFGVRWWLAARRRAQRATAAIRFSCGSFLLTSALASSYLYGNILGKTYKLEFGGLPYRNTNQYEAGYLGVVQRLPAFGPRERLLWEVIRKVPRGVPISTSGRINPQLSNRDVSMLYPTLGEGYPPDNQARYVVLDRFPSLYEAPEEAERKLLASGDYRVYFENPSGIILERIR